MSKARRWSARGVLAAVICLGSMAAGTGAASAGSTAALDVGDPATLLAGGAAVAVPLTVTCNPLPAPPPGSPPPSQRIGVAVFEVVNDLVVSGSGEEQTFTCDGTPQDVTVFVTPQAPGGPVGGALANPFDEGEAFVAASLETCTGAILPELVPLPAPPVCQRTEAHKVISISTGP